MEWWRGWWKLNRIDEMRKRLGRFNWLLSFLFNSSFFFLLGSMQALRCPVFVRGVVHGSVR